MALAPAMRGEHVEAAMLIRMAPDNLIDLIAAQRQMIVNQEFTLGLELHGRIDRVAFEVSRVNRKGRAGQPSEGGTGGGFLSKISGTRRMMIEFGEAGPRIAASRDHESLLVLGEFPKRLPKVNDPEWQPEVFPSPVPCPRHVAQLWEDLASGTWNRFLVFQPLVQVIFLSSAGTWGAVEFHGGKRPFEHGALLIDPRRRDGYFVGGKLRFRIGEVVK